MEDKTLATELLAELKAHGRRWFAIAIVEAVIIFAMAIFIVTTPVSEEYIQDANSDNNSAIMQSIGE